MPYLHNAMYMAYIVLTYHLRCSVLSGDSIFSEDTETLLFLIVLRKKKGKKTIMKKPSDKFYLNNMKKITSAFLSKLACKYSMNQLDYESS